MKNNIKILIVEDDLLTAETIERQLIKMGFTIIDIALTYKKAMAIIETKKLDLILLDIDLESKYTGIDIAYEEKVFHKIPIIYITGCKDYQTKKEVLATNPKNYLSKPLRYEELEMAISLALKLNEDNVTIDLGYNLTYAIKDQTLLNNETLIKLTPYERKLLTMLTQTKEQTIESTDLKHEIWGCEPPSEHSLRNLVFNLRKKLNPRKINPEMIITVSSVGYKLVLPKDKT